MSKKILVILGHSMADSLCGAISDRYVSAAQAAGHDVQLLQLGQLKFDPVLHQGYRQIQTLEPDLIQAQNLITWADHITLVYPVWWGGAPALLKGFIDRVFVPGFAFKFHPQSAFQEKLLRGRTAHLLVTMDTPPWYYRLAYRLPVLGAMRMATLSFCGIKTIRSAVFGPVVNASPKQITAWLAKTSQMAQKI